MPIETAASNPCTCPDCSSADLSVQIPVPIEAYRIALGQCVVAYKSSLDNGFDPEFVSNAIDQAVEETLMEHIVLHFAHMAASVCQDEAGE